MSTSPSFRSRLRCRSASSGVLEPAAAAKLAVARRARPSAVPDHVRLMLTLELRRELAEKLSLRTIKSERNIEANILALIEAVSFTRGEAHTNRRSRGCATE